MEYLFGLLVALSFVALVVLYDSMSCGFVLFKFYGWFVLPVVYFAPHITYWQAIGLMFVIALFKNHSIPELNEEHYKYVKAQRILGALLNPWMTLVIGWFVKLIIL